MDQPHMMNGIQTSAPSFLEIRPLGSSADRKETRKICLGQLHLAWYCPSNTYRLAVVEVVGVHAKLGQLFAV